MHTRCTCDILTDRVYLFISDNDHRTSYLFVHFHVEAIRHFIVLEWESIKTINDGIKIHGRKRIKWAKCLWARKLLRNLGLTSPDAVYRTSYICKNIELVCCTMHNYKMYTFLKTQEVEKRYVLMNVSWRCMLPTRVWLFALKTEIETGLIFWWVVVD